MVVKKDIVTIFEIKELNDGIEQLVPIKLLSGEHDESDNLFLGDDNEIYEHIEDISVNEVGFGKRFIFESDVEADFNDLFNMMFDACKSYRYIRYKENPGAVYIMSPKEGVTLLEDIDSKLNDSDDYWIDMPIPIELEKQVKETIKGQDEAVRKIITSLWMTINFPDITKRNMLIIGPTGVGKTAIFKKLQKILGLPLTIFSVPGLSQAGYSGRSTDEILKQIYYDCNADTWLANHSIVILDEIDKLAYSGSGSGEVSTSGVQNEILKIVEGVNRTVEIGFQGEYFEIDTSNIIFIGIGAFSELYDDKNNNHSIGFSSCETRDSKLDKKIDTEKLVNYGIKRELLGRFPIVVELNPMDGDMLRDIILNSDESELMTTVNSLAALGVTVRNLDELIDIVIDDAINRKIGARGLVTTINNIFLDIFYHVANNPLKYKEVIIGKNILKDNTDFELLTKKVRRKVKGKSIN